jgi:ubiquinone/menaquinone biosynthesis methyltransferase
MASCGVASTFIRRACAAYNSHAAVSSRQSGRYLSTAANSTAPPHQSQTVESYVSGSTTHFGFTSVSINEKESKVRQVFENVADNYDVMNDFMSAGLHRYWKDELLKMTGVAPMSKVIRRRASMNNYESSTELGNKRGSGFSILDVAGGTGDVAFRFIDAAKCEERAKSSGLDEIAVTVCDINPEMLRVGESRARKRFGSALLDDTRALTFVEGNAQYLPFEDNSFDLYTIAFGLRNVTDVDMALRDAYRVLKPGGRFMCLEFSHVTNVPLAKLYDLYSFNVIPQLGQMVANDRDSYQYLVESIRKFCTQEELVKRMEVGGFEEVKFTNMSGGIVAVHEGWKPL